MQHNIQASIKTFIEQATGTSCSWIYDGVQLPTTRPATSIEFLPSNVERLTKQRELYRTRYRFQIGVFAKSSGQAATMPHDLAAAFMFNPVPLLDTTNGGEQIGELDVIVERISPIPAAAGDAAAKHKTYIDVVVTVYRSSNAQ